MDLLRSKIKGLRRRNAMRRPYIPILSLESVMTIDAIREALTNSDVPSYHLEETLDRVSRNGVKIFAILLVLNYQDELRKFIESDQLDDAKLPLSVEILTQDILLSEETAKDFEEKQWEFIAPTFCRGTLHRRLGDSAILPFTQNKRIGKGAFGTVYEVAIDTDHQALSDGFSEVIARKEFDIERDHQKELDNLSKLNHLKHPNIVELLSSFTHDGKYSLLFPLAEEGNLERLLTKERHDTKFQSDQSLAVALAALASAVEHVHNFSQSKLDLKLIGCHHDLRPHNILVSEGRFILADFGLSTLKPASQDSQTPFKHGSDDYLAPECEDWDNGFQSGIVHRSADVWSFGCVVAEVATYMALGPEGVEEFRTARKHKVRGWTLRQFHQGPKRSSEAVSRWLSSLERSRSRTVALLVQVVRQVLCIDQLERPTAREVTRKLRLIAVHDAATTIDITFSQVREKYPSLDIALEHTRFNAWRHAMCLCNLEHEMQSSPNHTGDAMSQYDRILEGLDRLLEDVRTRLEQKPEAQYLDFSCLMSLNDNLQSFLTREQMETLREYFIITFLDEYGQSADQIGNEATCGTLSHEIRMRANIKNISNLLEENAVSAPIIRLIDPAAVDQLIPFGGHHHGRLSEGQATRPVWVEWRKYGKHGANEETTRKLYERASQSAELLAQVKPASFRTLTCIGFYHEPERAAFGMVFEFPALVAGRGSVKPTDLRQQIASTVKKRDLYPDLDDRYRLAWALAASLLEFHTVGWMHKSLNSSNIVFFPEESGDSDADSQRHRSQLIREPFLVGLNHSRPDDPTEFTTGAAESELRHYQHPTYLKEGRGYRLEYDYYSLGIILLEIGFWMPLAEFTREWVGSYEERRQRLVTKRVPRLRQHMGREYSEAVRCCLEGDFGRVMDDSKENVGDSGRETGSPRELKLEFGRRVVAPLSKYFA
ncbi:hypothetical protein DL764_010377 [Monosporascus ibericus]|uniref:Protein kinase domain-containing protein n=1 Tax=Monosporascus ibericus TaxID=155417 RepID=A0A4V1X8P7_9PEZI|nr:hypothetical protein DL764_010377 [Monosporascus ibericus]